MYKDKMMLSYSSARDSTILPFTQVIVCATKEGLIYRITGIIYPSQEEYSNVKKGIVETLAGKYQALSRYTPDPVYCEFGDKTNSVALEDDGYPLRLNLCYKNTPLADAALSDTRKVKEEEKTIEEQAIRNSLRGL